MQKLAEGGCEDEAALRIFLRDAERTFQDEGHRSAMIDALKSVWPENKDYHQGLGYISAFCTLFLPSQQARGRGARASGLSDVQLHFCVEGSL